MIRIDGQETKRGKKVRLSRVPLILLWGLILLVLVAACRSREPAEAPKLPVATVNGEQIGSGDFEGRLSEELTLVKGETALAAEQLESLKEEALGRTIEERLMLQRAQGMGLSVGSAELEARIGEIRKDYSDEGFNALFGKDSLSYPAWKEALRKRMLLEQVVAQDVNARIEVTDAEAERHFQTNRKTYVSGGRLHVVQIVVHEREQAEGILKRLKAGEDFGKLAREVSIAPEGSQGGDLGFVERGAMPEAIDRVVFSLPLGKLSRVVESPYGFHVFKILGREEAGGRTFADVRARVIADLRKSKEAEAYERWLDGLKARATILINRPLPDLPAPPVTKRDKRLEGEGKNE